MEIIRDQNENKGTFKAFVDGKPVGVMTYSIYHKGTITIDHTEVYEKFRKQGIGLELVNYAVNYARDNNLKIIAHCSFAKKIINANDDMKDVLHKAEMPTGRLEAFSDGVLAIIITIMVLELHVPTGGKFANLLPLWPKFSSYFLSFAYVGIYWNNHHHLFQVTKSVNASILWANLLALLSLSLLPFATAWMGENRFEQETVTFYGVILFACSGSFFILVRAILAGNKLDPKMEHSLRDQRKNIFSSVLYSVGIVLSFFLPTAEYIALIPYMVVALMWMVPDKRIENVFKDN